MSLIDEAARILMDDDHVDQALAVLRLSTAVEVVCAMADMMANLPQELADVITEAGKELDRIQNPGGRGTIHPDNLPPAADDPIPLPRQVPVTQVTGRRERRGRPKFTIVKGGKDD